MFLILAAVLVRGGTLAMLASSLEADPDGYHGLAESLASHGVFGSIDANGDAIPTAFRPPGYPWLLSWWVQNGRLTATAVAWLHGILGVLTIVLTFWLARRLFTARDPNGAEALPVQGKEKELAEAVDKRPLMAGLLVAIDPILLVQSAQVMTETLATFLAVVVWAVWLRLLSSAATPAAPIMAGFAFAGALTLACFSRPVFIVWAVLLIGWLVGLGLHRRRRSFLLIAATSVLVLGGAVAWWTERNRRMIGHPVWATSHGGYTLLLGNNPPFYDDLRSSQFGQAWQAEPFHRAWSYRYQADPFAQGFWKAYGDQPMNALIIEDEVIDDRLAYDVAKATIQQQPGMFIWASLVRVGNLWSPLPHVTDQRSAWQVWGIGAVYLVVMASVLVGVWSLRWKLVSSPWIPGLLLAVALTAVHAVYWSNLRMRAPAIPWLSLLAVAGIARFLHWTKWNCKS